MTSINGTRLGFWAGLVGITLVGAVVGVMQRRLDGWSLDSLADVANSAVVGGMTSLIYLGLPAGLIGLLLGTIIDPNVEYLEVNSARKPHAVRHPLDD